MSPRSSRRRACSSRSKTRNSKPPSLATSQRLRSLAALKSDTIGYVYAVNGRISGGDIYPSPVLFRKLWPKLLEASATEAVAQRAADGADRTLAIDAVVAFLTAADGTAPTAEQLPAGVTLITRDSEEAAAFETRTAAADGWVHRNYIAK